MKFEFATAGRILFGVGSSRQLPSLVARLGTRALLVLGGSRRHGETLSPGLEASGVRSMDLQRRGQSPPPTWWTRPRRRPAITAAIW